MNDEDRKKIKKNLVALEKRLRLDDRFQRLMIQKKVFSQVMLDDILDDPSPNLDFCMKLMLRGPRAFQRFLDALAETEQFDILRRLEPGLDIDSVTGSNRLGVTMRSVAEPVTNGALNGIPHSMTNSNSAASGQYDGQSKLFVPPRGSSGPPDNRPSSYVPRSNGASSSHSPPTNYGDSDRDLEFESNGVLKFEVKPSTMSFYNRTQEDKLQPSYRITLGKTRGRVLIININSFDHNLYQTRVGSETDVTNLDKLFTELNYTVNIKQDVNYEQFESEIKHFAQREDHGDSCFVFIMSHGDDLGNGHWGIATRDNRKIDLEDIIANFSNQRAKSLIYKPKIIVVNACRGQTSDKGVAHSLPCVSAVPPKRPRVYNDGNNESPDVLLRTFDDMMYVKSTPFGFASHREENRGSWLIMALCHVFAQKACEMDVEKMFKRVDEKVKLYRGLENQRQTIECSTRGMNKALYLYPGLS